MSTGDTGNSMVQDRGHRRPRRRSGRHRLQHRHFRRRIKKALFFVGLVAVSLFAAYLLSP